VCKKFESTESKKVLTSSVRNLNTKKHLLTEPKKSVTLNLKLLQSLKKKHDRYLPSRKEEKKEIPPSTTLIAEQMCLRYKINEIGLLQRVKEFYVMHIVFSAKNDELSISNSMDDTNVSKIRSFIIKEIEQTIVSSSKLSSVLVNTKDEEIKLPSFYPSILYASLYQKGSEIYQRMLASIDLNKDSINVEEYIKLYYYFIDRKATKEEAISICSKV
jgi:hypothetical protein